MALWPSGAKAVTVSSGHLADEPGAGHIETHGILLARVADQDLVVQAQGHAGEVLRHLACADDEQAPLRAVMRNQMGLAQDQDVGACLRRQQLNFSGVAVQYALHPFTTGQAGQ